MSATIRVTAVQTVFLPARCKLEASLRLAGLFAGFTISGEKIEVMLGASGGDVVKAVLIFAVSGMVVAKNLKKIVFRVIKKELIIGFEDNNDVRFKTFRTMNREPIDFLVKFLGGEDVVLDGDLF